MKRIVLFLATNLAILMILSITLSLLGVDGYLDEPFWELVHSAH